MRKGQKGLPILFASLQRFFCLVLLQFLQHVEIAQVRWLGAMADLRRVAFASDANYL